MRSLSRWRMNLAIGRDETKSYVGYAQLLKTLCLAAAYDKVMSSGSEPDFKIASTTTRMYDMVNRGPAFDEIYIHPPLLEACAHVIGEPFKLSSLLARTLRAKTPAQDLHVD